MEVVMTRRIAQGGIGRSYRVESVRAGQQWQEMTGRELTTDRSCLGESYGVASLVQSGQQCGHGVSSEVLCDALITRGESPVTRRQDTA
jgi:hypothetical protein